MKLLKRFCAKKRVSGPKQPENNDLEKLTKFFEQLDPKQIKNLNYFQNILKKNSSKEAIAVHSFIGDAIEWSELKKAEKVVKEYGQAIIEASDINKRKVKNFKTKNLTTKELSNLDKVNCYILQGKFDIRSLPYDKQTIKEAIELLLRNETDVEKIETLRIGLLYLDDFIDFSL